MNKLLKAAVYICILCIGNPTIGESSDSKVGENTYGPIDMLDAVNTSIEFEKERQKIIKTTEDGNISVSTDGLFFKVLKKNKWLVTQALLFGVNNLDAGITALQSAEAIELLTNADAKAAATMHKYLTGDKKTVAELDSGYYSGRKGTKAFRKGKAVRNLVDQVTAFSYKVEHLKNFPGFSGGGTADSSLFKRTQWIGLVILVLCYVFRLAWDMYEKNVIHQGESHILDSFYTTIKFMFLFVAILFLREFITKGMDISDTIRQSIESTVVGLDSWDIMNDLLRVKSEIAQINGSIGILDWLKEGAGVVIAKGLGFLCYMIASAVIAVLLILSDIMMAITAVVGPFTLGMSMLPKFGQYIQSWIKGYITFLIWSPLAALYVLMFIAIMAIGIDTSAITFIVISIGYLMGAMQIPNMAESMSGAVLTGVATGLAAAPIAAAKLGGRLAGGSVAKGGAMLVGGRK